MVEKAAAKKKGKAWLWVIVAIVIVVLIGGFIALLLFGGLIAAIFMAQHEPAGEEYYGTATMPLGLDSSDYGISRSDQGEECRFSISGTVDNPNSMPVYGVSIDCVAMRGYSDYGAGYAAGLSYGSGYEYIGIIPAGGSGSFSFDFTGYKLDPSESCSNYGVTCDVDY
jgi:hypothetical protein